MKKAIIVLVTCFSVGLLGNSRPFHFSTDRDTTKARVTVAEGNRMVDDIYNTIQSVQQSHDSLRQRSDSNFTQWGIDTTNAASTDTITLSIKYENVNYGIFPVARGADAGFVTAWPLTDSSFAIKFGGTNTFPYQWHTIGIRKTE